MANAILTGVAGDGETPAGRGSQREESLLVALGMAAIGLAVIAILVLAIEPLRTGVFNAVEGDTESLRRELRSLDFGGVLIVLSLALLHAVVWYPTEILDAAAGFVYGFWAALALVMVGWVLNGIIGHAIGRRVARPVLYRVINERRFERMERAVHRGGVTLLLGMRLVPIIPFSLFSIAAGAARVPMGTFIWTTAVGYLPLTAVFVYLGSRLEELSPTDPVIWIGAAVVIVLLLLTRRLHRAVVADPDRAGADAEAAEVGWRPAAAVALVLGSGGLLVVAGVLAGEERWAGALGLAVLGAVVAQAGFFVARGDTSPTLLPKSGIARGPFAAELLLMLAAGATMAATGYIAARGGWLAAGFTATLGGALILAAYVYDRRARSG